MSHGCRGTVGPVVSGLNGGAAAAPSPFPDTTELAPTPAGSRSLSCRPPVPPSPPSLHPSLSSISLSLSLSLSCSPRAPRYARSPELVQNADNLTANAEACAQAFRDEDLERIGACLNLYWEQKKVMAPGCEPSFVRAMIDVMAPHAYGQSMAGAGGGGFMYVITKEPNMAAKMEELVRATIPGVEMVRFHDVTVDEEGIVITTVE